MIKDQIRFYLENAKQIFSIKFISVLIISVPSAIVAEYLNIPLAWFLGPMIITSIAALSGLKIIMPKIVLSFILIILGLHIGNYIDQNLFNQMINWIWTSLIMLIYIIICILVVSFSAIGQVYSPMLAKDIDFSSECAAVINYSSNMTSALAVTPIWQEDFSNGFPQDWSRYTSNTQGGFSTCNWKHTYVGSWGYWNTNQATSPAPAKIETNVSSVLEGPATLANKVSPNTTNSDNIPSAT